MYHSGRSTPLSCLARSQLRRAWRPEATQNLYLITDAILSSRIKLHGPNSCANQVLFDGGADVPSINAGHGLFIILRESRTVFAEIVGTAEYNEEVTVLRHATTQIELQPHTIYDIHGDSQERYMFPAYKISVFDVLQRTGACTVPCSLGVDKMIRFLGACFMRSTEAGVNKQQLCAECRARQVLLRADCTQMALTNAGEPRLCLNSAETKSKYLLSDSIAAGCEIVTIDHTAMAPGFLSTRYMKRTLDVFQDHLRVARMRMVSLSAMSAALGRSSFKLLVDLATMRATYKKLDGSNLSMLADVSAFSGSFTISEPTPLTFAQLERFAVYSEEGVYAFYRGSFARVSGR
eukprot:IDg2213t1